jgi:hypothetical protein
MKGIAGKDQLRAIALESLKGTGFSPYINVPKSSGL